jgi:DNA polymerase/3'-5' exonuclease PolX
MNSKIVKNFEVLVKFIQAELNKLKSKDIITKTTFRLNHIRKSLSIIKKYPKKLNLNNLDEFQKLPGIGQGTIDRIKEIIKTGKLKEIQGFKENPNEKIINKLTDIVGIGRSKALELIKKGITSIKQLKSKIENNEIKVNDKIKLGIYYYGKFFGNIPRNEITEIKELLEKVIDNINKLNNLNDTNKYIIEICGSYRREKTTSGDIDVLISKLGSDPNNVNHLDKIISKLKEPISYNNNKPLLTDDLTDKNYKTKYMGFLKYKDNPYRRIDIRFIHWHSYFTALMYFTGSKEFNQKTRLIAKKLGYKLSEYELTKISNNTNITIKSEEDIFKILNMDYIPPNLR